MTCDPEKIQLQLPFTLRQRSAALMGAISDYAKSFREEGATGRFVEALQNGVFQYYDDQAAPVVKEWNRQDQGRQQRVAAGSRTAAELKNEMLTAITGLPQEEVERMADALSLIRIDPLKPVDAKTVLSAAFHDMMTTGEDRAGIAELLPSASESRVLFEDLLDWAKHQGLLNEDVYEAKKGKYLAQIWKNGKPDYETLAALRPEITPLSGSERTPGLYTMPIDKQTRATAGMSGQRFFYDRDFEVVPDRVWAADPEMQRDPTNVAWSHAVAAGLLSDPASIVAQAAKGEAQYLGLNEMLTNIADPENNQGLSVRVTQEQARELESKGEYKQLELSAFISAPQLRRLGQRLRTIPGFDALMDFTKNEQGQDEVILVYAPIADQINAIIGSSGPFRKFADRYYVPLFRAWKQWRILRPAGYINNLVSVQTFAHLSPDFAIIGPDRQTWMGVEKRNINSLQREFARGWREKSPEVMETIKLAQQYGIDTVPESAMYLGELFTIEEIDPDEESMRLKVQRMIDRYPALRKLQDAKQMATDLYVNIDRLARLSAFHHFRVERGMTAVEAAERVDQTFPNPNHVPTWVKQVSKYYVPFMGYPYEAARIMSGHAGRAMKAMALHVAGEIDGKEAMRDYLPMLQMAGTMAGLSLVSAAAMAAADLDEDEQELLERHSSGLRIWLPNPAWLAGDESAPLSLNLTYMVPFIGDLMSGDRPEAETATYQRGPLGLVNRMVESVSSYAVSNPFISTAASMAQQRDIRTGAQLSNEASSPSEKFANNAEYVYMQMAPPLVGHNLKTLYQGIAQTPDFTGTGPKYGRMEAFTRFLGVPVQSQKLERLVVIERVQLNRRINALEKEIRRVQNERQTGRLPGEEATSRTEVLKRRIADEVEAYQNRLDGLSRS